jgi:hypothetical protein
MKIDMTPAAVTVRLRQVAQLRHTCLMLAKSKAGVEIRRRHSSNNLVQRTSRAIGR